MLRYPEVRKEIEDRVAFRMTQVEAELENGEYA
jgi:hypothetical protein